MLCAGGAIASHFAGLGIPGIVSFTIGSGVCMLAFISLCICSSKPTKNEKNQTRTEEHPLPCDLNDPREDYKNEISAIRSKVRPLNDTGEYWEIISFIQRSYTNSNAMDFLIVQYQSMPKWLGLWIARPPETAVEGKRYNSAPNKALFSALRRQPEIFKTVIRYWFKEGGGIPVCLFDRSIKFDDIAAIVHEALQSDESTETLIWDLIDARYNKNLLWLEVDPEAIKIQQSIILGMIAVQKPQLVKHIISQYRGQKVLTTYPKTGDELIIDGLKEAHANKCLSDAELNVILDKIIASVLST